VISFVIGGALCGFAGVLLLGTIGSADPSTTGSYLLGPYAAAFVGTAVIQEGRFNIIGTVIGVYLISVADIGLELFGAPTWFGQVFSGLILIFALAVARLGARTRRVKPAAIVQASSGPTASGTDPEPGADRGTDTVQPAALVKDKPSAALSSDRAAEARLT
jgi:ABC-type uncharacterized transport system permease subunit